MFQDTNPSPITPPTSAPVVPKAPVVKPALPETGNVSFAGRGNGEGFPVGQVAAAGIVLLLMIGGLIFGAVKFVNRPTTPKSVQNQNATTSGAGLDLAASSTPGLPNASSTGLTTDNGLADSQKIEYLTFADFYNEPSKSYQVNLNNYNLPLDIKTAVLNYYDVSRKLNIDNNLTELNNLGFTTMDNQLKSVDDKTLPADNFFSAYKTLNTLGLPLLFTSDFITYYYQNINKKIFKDIEKNVFYNNMWDISSKMFEVARDRYNQRLAQVGNINDPILEGARMEMAYFATALEIMQPTKEQIGNNSDRSAKELFTNAEAKYYAFTVPEYLKVDVDREVALIREHGQKIKSPVLLYPVDYSDFALPVDYVNSAKLTNFYLTTRWLNSPFPAYYQSAACPSCSLDIDDWRVRVVAANYIAQDLFNDYYLKAKWAGIYKVMGYFKGLRGGLTFVNFRDALSEVFGTDAKIEELFDSKNPAMPDNFKKLQDKVLTYTFGDIESAYKLKEVGNPNKVGAAMLLEPYWPNNYIFGALSYPTVGLYKGKYATKPNSNTTACQINNLAERCNGFGLDMINLIHPVPSSNNYFVENTNYNNYTSSTVVLKDSISYIKSNWNYNNFWSTLKMLQSSLSDDQSIRPVFARNDIYDKKEINRSLATWVNLQLPMDVFDPYKEKTGSAMGATNNDYFKSVQYAYVEPNLGLIDELIANAEMTDKMFQALKIYNDVSSASGDLRDLLYRLNILRGIMVKELNSQNIEDADYQFLDKLSKEYQVKTNATKSFVISGKNGSSITESLPDIKLELLIQKRGNDLILNVGPAFNYWEKK
ncbi:MAG: DUF3160 domain-containing protein [Candidatus Falkowbacteria bacterium]